jgi:hypothetical protein
MLTPLNPANVRTLIQQTLTPIGIYSRNAEELLLATCANESNFGEYRTQDGDGPARGIFQMEGEDFNDIWTNYLAYHGTLAFQIKNYNAGQQGTVDDLVNNDPYAICMARVHYCRAPGALPDFNDIEAIWAYYKKYYNTPQGAATHDAFIAKYNKFVLGQ